LKRLVYIYIWVGILFFSLQSGNVAARNIVFDGRIYDADSILNNVRQMAPSYALLFDDYYADFYVKERLNILKKNYLFRYLPFMFHIKHNERQYIREMFTQVHYTSPNIYDRKIIVSVGTIPRRRSLMNALVGFFHINIYSTTLLYNKLLSPLTPKSNKYYRYELDSVFSIGGKTQYKINFIPKSSNDQLVRGYMIISDRTWSIREFHLSGSTDLNNFEGTMFFGEVGSPEELLPVKYRFNIKIGLLWNSVHADYLSNVTYRDIRIKGFSNKHPRKSKYDLTNSYTLTTDTNAYLVDRSLVERVRPVPLDSLDKAIYNRYDQLRYDETHHIHEESRAKVLWGQVGDFFLDKYNINFANAGSIRCSPLLNPFLLSYSKNNGLSYRQTFKYNCLFRGDRLLRIAPRVGYNFTRNEFYWKVNSEYDYFPQRHGELHIDIGNGNRIYSSDVLDDLKSMPDSIFNFNKVNLFYFRDNYIDIYHRIDLMNGFNVAIGLSMHRRTPVEKYQPKPGDPSEIKEKIRDSYSSFAPRVSINWTPALYYYMSGHRKVDLQSKYPTFNFEWERGIKDVLGSDGKYERIEFNVQHTVPLGLLRTIYYRFGGGAFTNQHQLYFVDFVNFSRNNLPEGWNDEISGSFQLLDAPWYNSSRKYFQAHFTYESPFFIFPRLMKIMRNVVNERLYTNILFVHHLAPYVEIGYGIGTPIFNFGIFSSFNKREYMETGCKFTFELFDK
jgi:hypothetical protein